MRAYMPEDSVADDKPKQFLGLSGPQTIGSALAAVTSALVGSFTGVAGTLIGAALGSVVATVGAALYARTLSSAATVALKKIPQRGRGGLTADDGGVPAGGGEPRVKRVRRQFTRKTWISVGAVSAAAFIIAMVGVTAVEFGTKQPISSLVSSTSSIDRGATGPTTTLGTALGGNPTVSDKTDTSTKDTEQAPGQTEEDATKTDGPTTDGSPGRGDSGTAGTEAPGAGTSSDTAPADVTPTTEPSPEPAPETEQTSEPQVSPDPGSGSAEQPPAR